MVPEEESSRDRSDLKHKEPWYDSPGTEGHRGNNGRVQAEEEGRAMQILPDFMNLLTKEMMYENNTLH